MAELESGLVKYKEAITCYEVAGKNLSREMVRSSQLSFSSGEIDFFRLAASMDRAIDIELNYLENLSKYNQLGKAVSAETRSVLCYAAIDPEEKTSFLENMYVEAEIITCEREALASPETALIREPYRDYVLILLEENKQSYTFRKMPVQTGVTRDGFTEILDTDLSSLLVEGGFGLWTDE